MFLEEYAILRTVTDFDEYLSVSVRTSPFISKMPSGEGYAAMGFQIGFKCVGFFFVLKGDSVFDPPRAIPSGVRHIAFVVFFKACFQIFGTANVKMRSKIKKIKFNN